MNLRKTFRRLLAVLASCYPMCGAALGCPNDSDPVTVPLEDRITFNKHVAPIIYAKCGVCHRPGGAAPAGADVGGGPSGKT